MSNTQNVIATIVYGDVPGFPAGTVLDHITATLTGSTAGAVPISQTVPPATANVTFASVPPDTYTYSVQGIDAGGNALGTAVTGSFTVGTPDQTVTLSLPASATLVQP